MKTYHFAKLMPVLLLLLVAGCKKEEEFKTAPAVIKSVSQSPGGSSTSFAYDGQGRLTNKNNSDGSKLNIVYNGDTVVESYFGAGGVVAYTRILVLDTATGLAMAGVELDSAGNLRAALQFGYDGGGRRTLEQLLDSVQNVLVKKEWSYDGEGDLKSYFVTDNVTPENTCQFYYWQHYIEQKSTGTTGQAYQGKGTYRLTKSMVRFNYLLGNIRYGYTYTFDEYNRVSSENAYDHNDVLKYTNTYTYN